MIVPAMPYKIVGHRLCPYVQRVVIVMLERGMTYDRIDIDLDAKPDWLAQLSPNGQVPVLRTETGAWLFESGAISRYLVTVSGGGLLPPDPLNLARHEAWISHADAMLSIAARMIYSDPDASALRHSAAAITDRLTSLCDRFPPAPYFAGPAFGLVDAVLATLVRNFAVLDRLPAVTLMDAAGGAVRTWWQSVGNRPSVAAAVPPTYEAELARFIAEKDSFAGRQMALAV